MNIISNCGIGSTGQLHSQNKFDKYLSFHNSKYTHTHTHYSQGTPAFVSSWEIISIIPKQFDRRAKNNEFEARAEEMPTLRFYQNKEQRSTESKESD